MVVSIVVTWFMETLSTWCCVGRLAFLTRLHSCHSPPWLYLFADDVGAQERCIQWAAVNQSRGPSSKSWVPALRLFVSHTTLRTKSTRNINWAPTTLITGICCKAGSSSCTRTLINPWAKNPSPYLFVYSWFLTVPRCIARLFLALYYNTHVEYVFCFVRDNRTHDLHKSQNGWRRIAYLWFSIFRIPSLSQVRHFAYVQLIGSAKK